MPLDKAALTGPILHPWDCGDTVAELQELLCAHGFVLRVDGSFGWITEAAVINFQRQHGLRMDGVVAIKTWAVLKGTVRAGSRSLRQGHTGADVYELQGLLRVHGYSVDRQGVFDEATLQAVQKFQERYRLKQTGQVDAVTWTALRGTERLPKQPKQSHWFMNYQKWW